MSRPFSYNDENFTVIGNVLFCHVKIEKAILKNNPIAEIPPAIYSRMLFKSQYFTLTLTDIDTSNIRGFSVGVGKQDDNKYFLFCSENIEIIGSYIVGYYILKDI